MVMDEKAVVRASGQKDLWSPLQLNVVLLIYAGQRWCVVHSPDGGRNHYKSECRLRF